MSVVVQATDPKAIAIIAAIAIGGTAGGNFVWDKSKPELVTKAELEQIKDTVQRERDFYRREISIRLSELENSIRRDMPPENTKLRIEEMEKWIREQDPNWRPPTHRFGVSYNVSSTTKSSQSQANTKSSVTARARE